MKVFIVMYLIVLCFKALSVHAALGCDAVVGAYISGAPSSQALRAFSEGQAAKEACERGVPISVLLQRLQQRNASHAYENRIPSVAPTSPTIEGVTCQNYGFGTEVVCTVR